MIAHEFPLFSAGPKFDVEWACTFAGEVEEWFDPVERTSMWTCPVCLTDHDTSAEAF